MSDDVAKSEKPGAPIRVLRIVLILIVALAFAALGLMIAAPRRFTRRPSPPPATQKFDPNQWPMMEGMERLSVLRSKEEGRWILRLSAPAEPAQAATWYSLEMRKHGWEEKEVGAAELETEGARVLVFSKGRRKCIMRIEPAGSYASVINVIIF